MLRLEYHPHGKSAAAGARELVTRTCMFCDLRVRVMSDKAKVTLERFCKTTVCRAYGTAPRPILCSLDLRPVDDVRTLRNTGVLDTLPVLPCDDCQTYEASNQKAHRASDEQARWYCRYHDDFGAVWTCDI